MHDLSKCIKFWVNLSKNPNAVLVRIKIQGLKMSLFGLVTILVKCLISDKTIELD